MSVHWRMLNLKYVVAAVFVAFYVHSFFFRPACNCLPLVEKPGYRESSQGDYDYDQQQGSNGTTVENGSEAANDSIGGNSNIMKLNQKPDDGSGSSLESSPKESSKTLSASSFAQKQTPKTQERPSAPLFRIEHPAEKLKPQKQLQSDADEEAEASQHEVKQNTGWPEQEHGTSPMDKQYMNDLGHNLSQLKFGKGDQKQKSFLIPEKPQKKKIPNPWSDVVTEFASVNTRTLGNEYPDQERAPLWNPIEDPQGAPKDSYDD